MLLKRSFTEKHDRLHQNAVVSMAVLCSEAVVLLLLRSSIHSVASWAFHTVPWFHYLIGNWRGKERLNNFQEKSHTKKAFILFPISMSSFKCNYFYTRSHYKQWKRQQKLLQKNYPALPQYPANMLNQIKALQLYIISHLLDIISHLLQASL